MNWWRATWEHLHRGGWLEIRSLLALAVILFSIFAFLEIADEVTEGDSNDFDRAALVWLREPDAPQSPRGPLWLPEVARDITALGSGSVLILLTLIVAGGLWLRGRRRLVALLIVGALGASGLSATMKYFFDRERPEAVFQLMPVSAMSFPSGHSTLSAAIYLLLGLMLATASSQRRLKIYFLAAAAVVTLLVGLTRIYLGAHFPTDVAAGWCVGAAWAFGCALIAERLNHSRPGRRDSGIQPAPSPRP